MRQDLRQEKIDSTRVWRAEQIATRYTYEQAAAFPSLRAILRTLPCKQPRAKKGPEVGKATPTVPSQERPPEPLSAANDEATIVERFIKLGIAVRDLLGDEAFDNAVEQIKSHVSETFEDTFMEV